jgi:hypothetical protein
MAFPTHVVIIGHIGSDAGYTWIDAQGHVHHVPGWQPEELREVATAINILSQATAFKTPGLSERVVGVLREFVQGELSSRLKDGGAGGISVIALPG